jgi:tetratricopeptide (TPR) repeat protein
MNRLLPACLLLCAACSTPKVAATEALGPELTVHTVPEGAEVFRDGRSLGLAPVLIPIRRGDAQLNLEAHLGGYLPAKATLDGAGLRQAGGGETWLALKADTMGTDTPELDASKPADLERGGIALTKAKRCPEAMQFFDRALAVDPRFARAHRDKGRCLAKQKKFDQAVIELEKYLNQDSDAPDVAKVADDVERYRAHRDIDLGGGADDEQGRR